MATPLGNRFKIVHPGYGEAKYNFDPGDGFIFSDDVNKWIRKKKHGKNKKK